MGDDKQLPVCKYGSKCYRKSKSHLENYSHPHTKTHNTDVEEPVKKKAKIEDFFSGGKQKKSADEAKKPTDNATTSVGSDQEVKEPVSPDKVYADEEKDKEDASSNSQTITADPVDVREDIKSKFLMEMPEDFYQFWEFAKSLHPKNPQDAFKASLGLTLVGPYDVLAGKCKSHSSSAVCYLTHYRYCFDPPEFLTVVKGSEKTQFHFGYYRDDPSEMPVFVASNSAAENCILSARGENLFTAINWFIEERLKEGKTKMLCDLKAKCGDCARHHNLSLEPKTKAMKARNKTVVAKTFHGAGIVVPVDKTGVGYRPLPETTGGLKKILKRIIESKDETERDQNLDPLMEIVMLIQFANDECDYGEGLELGLDLFSYTADDCFHKVILSLLPLAYQFLNRDVFAKIIEAHLANRKRTGNLSVLS